ncbi:MAG: class I SAM-dependent methyltransferase [Rhizobiales bacterium]|nr:class I SAM-dependent methyltransferase [Hyphomicrobiales bacterium]
MRFIRLAHALFARLTGHRLVAVKAGDALASRSGTLFEPTRLDAGALEADGNPLARYFLASSSASLHKWHHYFAIYHAHLARYRGAPGLRMLEIGVSEGGSLGMWRSYFGPDSTIVGLDIDATCRRFERAREGIHVRIGDQEDAGFLEAVVAEFGPFDIIIDDGGHTTSQQIASFEALYRAGLRDEAVYLVEDTHTNYWDTFKTEPGGETFIGFAKGLVDQLHEPYLEGRRLKNFAMENPSRITSLDVSWFAANTHAIAFYDSIVVIERRPRLMPVVEKR